MGEVIFTNIYIHGRRGGLPHLVEITEDGRRKSKRKGTQRGKRIENMECENLKA